MGHSGHQGDRCGGAADQVICETFRIRKHLCVFLMRPSLYHILPHPNLSWILSISPSPLPVLSYPYCLLLILNSPLSSSSSLSSITLPSPPSSLPLPQVHENRSRLKRRQGKNDTNKKVFPSPLKREIGSWVFSSF